MARTRSEWCSRLSDRSKSAEFFGDQTARAEVSVPSVWTWCSAPHIRHVQLSRVHVLIKYLYRAPPRFFISTLLPWNQELFTSSGTLSVHIVYPPITVTLGLHNAQWRATALAVCHNGPSPRQPLAAGVRRLSWQAARLSSSFTTSFITLYKGWN